MVSSLAFCFVSLKNKTKAKWCYVFSADESKADDAANADADDGEMESACLLSNTNKKINTI